MLAVQQAAQGCLAEPNRASSRPSEPLPEWTLTDDQTFRLVWLIALLLMVVAVTIPFAGRHRYRLRQAAIWVLVGGFVFAFYRIAEWLLS
jgi:hypothetical protein